MTAGMLAGLSVCAGATESANSVSANEPEGAFHGLWRNAGMGRQRPDQVRVCCTEEGWQDYATKLQPWAMDVMVKRDAALQAGKPLPTNTSSCLPDGTPTVIDIPYASQFIFTPTHTYILYEADNQSRRIRMNSTHPAKLKPSWYGDSIGRWEGDTLVIDTVGLSARGQLNWDGIPHTDALHVVERYSIAPSGLLELRMTLTDPGALTEPWTILKHFRRQTEQQLYEYVCAQNNREFAVATE